MDIPNHINRKNILITGCAGFIGSHLFRSLQEIHNVYGLDCLTPYYDINLKKKRLDFILNKNNFFMVDLCDKEKITEIIDKFNISIIIHLAAQAGVRYSIENPETFIENNIIGSFNLFESLKSKKIEHLLIASTSSVYGFNSAKKFSEFDNSDKPVSFYSATKKSVEVISHAYSLNYSIPTTIFRFFTVYGPWGRPDMALFKFIKSMINSESIDVYNHGNMWRDYTYIDDLVEAINKLIFIPPETDENRHNFKNFKNLAPYRIVNIGNSEPINLKKFIKTIENITQLKAKINYLPLQIGDVNYTSASNDLLFELTGYKPRTTIDEGIKNFYEWYKSYYGIM